MPMSVDVVVLWSYTLCLRENFIPLVSCISGDVLYDCHAINKEKR